MRVVRAQVMGFCVGVREALRRAEGVEDPAEVTIHGELVHNSEVLGSLRAAGYEIAHEGDRGRVPETPSVLITAHGISERERRRLESAGKSLIDTTCPLVARAHRVARGLAAAGYHVLLIGRRGHVEVAGIVEDLEDGEVVESVSEVRRYPHRRIGILCQTTAPAADVEAIRAAIVERNPQAHVRFVDTVCRPTKERRTALEGLLPGVDAVVVVGGLNSNNTLGLVALCRTHGVPVLHVENTSDLDAAWARRYRVVGLTAGASTPDAAVDEVERGLRAIRPAPVEVTP